MLRNPMPKKILRVKTLLLIIITRIVYVYINQNFIKKTSGSSLLPSSYLSTFKTRMVQAVEMTVSLYLFFSLSESCSEIEDLPSGRVCDTSLGLLDPDVAIAKAVAAPEVLLLQKFLN